MIFTKAVRLQKPLVEASEVAFGVEAMLVKVAIMGWSQLFQLPWMHVILVLKRVNGQNSSRKQASQLQNLQE